MVVVVVVVMGKGIMDIKNKKKGREKVHRVGLGGWREGEYLFLLLFFFSSMLFLILLFFLAHGDEDAMESSGRSGEDSVVVQTLERCREEREIEETRRDKGQGKRKRR